jgi:hypothetical protein
MPNNKLHIRSSTAEFLIFTNQNQAEEELNENSVVEDFSVTATNGNKKLK